jgi:hypothetical protein
MSINPTPEEQTATAGLTCGRGQDIACRTGLVLQVLGAAILSVLYPLQSPFYTVGIMLFEAGALLSALFLPAWKPAVKKLIIGSIAAGLALQIAGFHAQEQNAGLMIIAGLGLVCSAAAGMAGKEAYCFGYWEGWLLIPAFPFMVLVNLFCKENHALNSVGFSLVFLLLLSLAGKKLKRPLLSTATNACGDPEKKA